MKFRWSSRFRAARASWLLGFSLGAGVALLVAAQVVKQVEQPIFFIHGEDDSVIPAEETSTLHDISGNPEDRIWIVPNTEHINIYRKMPEVYVNHISQFFQRHIG